MPKQVCPLVEAIVGSDQMINLAADKLLHISRLTRSPRPNNLPVQAPLPSPPCRDGQRDVENAKGDSKGSED